MHEMELAARRERLLDLGMTEVEIASTTEAGLNAVIEKLRLWYRRERLHERRGSKLHVASLQSLIFTAIQAERKIRRLEYAPVVGVKPGPAPGPISEYYAPKPPTPEEIFNRAVGSNIAEQRVEAEHSVDWLAHALACSHRHVELIEAGEIPAGTAELAKIAAALSVTILDLVPADLRRRLQKPAPVVPETLEQSPQAAQSLPVSAAA